MEKKVRQYEITPEFLELFNVMLQYILVLDAARNVRADSVKAELVLKGAADEAKEYSLFIVEQDLYEPDKMLRAMASLDLTLMRRDYKVIDEILGCFSEGNEDLPKNLKDKYFEYAGKILFYYDSFRGAFPDIEEHEPPLD